MLETENRAQSSLSTSLVAGLQISLPLKSASWISHSTPVSIGQVRLSSKDGFLSSKCHRPERPRGPDPGSPSSVVRNTTIAKIPCWIFSPTGQPNSQVSSKEKWILKFQQCNGRKASGNRRHFQGHCFLFYLPSFLRALFQFVNLWKKTRAILECWSLEPKTFRDSHTENIIN